MNCLREYAKEYGIELSDEMTQQFREYLHLLLEWNERMNLTAITDHQEVCIKHFLDSLLVLDAVVLPEKATVLDVGTGAGFPGIPMKIVRPDISLTLLDSLNKRVGFLQEVSDRLGQNNHCVHGRAEELGQKEGYREKFDLVTARAVAALPVLSEYCIPFVRQGGVFAALKGYEIEGELSEAGHAVSLLGAEVNRVAKYTLPMDNRRAIVVIRKLSQTPAKYPRNRGKMLRMPL